MVESGLTSKLPNFNLSSGFYSLPGNIAQYILSRLFNNPLHVALNIHVATSILCPHLLSIIHYASGAPV